MQTMVKTFFLWSWCQRLVWADFNNIEVLNTSREEYCKNIFFNLVLGSYIFQLNGEGRPKYMACLSAIEIWISRKMKYTHTIKINLWFFPNTIIRPMLFHQRVWNLQFLFSPKLSQCYVSPPGSGAGYCRLCCRVHAVSSPLSNSKYSGVIDLQNFAEFYKQKTNIHLHKDDPF